MRRSCSCHAMPCMQRRRPCHAPCTHRLHTPVAGAGCTHAAPRACSPLQSAHAEPRAVPRHAVLVGAVACMHTAMRSGQWTTSASRRMRDYTGSASRPASAPGGWAGCLRARVCSDCPRCPPSLLITRIGEPARRRLLVFPNGEGERTGTHLSVFLEAQDTMWAPTAACKFTLINQSDASKKTHKGGE
jgi:hypothetical protein